MTSRNELFAYLAVVIYLAVKDDDLRAVLVEDRLVARRAYVYDTQSSVTEGDIPVHILAIGVGTAVTYPVHHFTDDLVCVVDIIGKANYAAHIFSSD